MSPNRVKAAAIGGAAAGLASSIPIVEFLNLACCALIVGGALLAVYLALRNEPPTENPPLGDGAAIGALSGAFAAVVGAIVSIPFALIAGEAGDAGASAIQDFLESDDGAAIEGPLRDFLEYLAGSGEGILLGGFLIGFGFSLVLYTIFGALGGVLGAAIFNRKA